MKMLNQYSFKNSFNITKKLVLKLQHKNFFSGLSTSNLNLEKINQRVFCLTLCRHDGKNSFSKEMVSDFNSAINALRELNRDEAAVTVLILKSSVDRVFCAGADLKERLSMPEDQIAPFVTSLRDAFTNLADAPFVSIAAIEGSALGGGLELALACDIRVASNSAKLGLPETGLAIIPGAGGTQRLPRIVGLPKAKEMIYLGSILTAAKALSISLVNEVVEDGQAFNRAVQLAEVLATKGPVALRQAKAAIDGGVGLGLPAALEVERNAYGKLVHTRDRTEGLLAFKEKRPPSYTGQ